jgi:signal transduction histidine kinase
MREYVSYKLQLQSEIDKMESEKQKREAKERESKLLVSVVGNMAHDLKTPLQSFCMAVESLQRTIGRNLPGDLEMTKDLFDTIKATASFMEMAINRSMDFTKAAGDVTLKAKYEVVDLVGAISWATTCVTDASNNVTTFTATLHPIPQEVCRHVITDMHWLKENVLCFLSNAAKYSDYRPVDVFVSVTRDALADEDSLFLRVAVQDSGVGIPDNVKEVLFQPFKQVQRLAGGTGSVSTVYGCVQKLLEKLVVCVTDLMVLRALCFGSKYRTVRITQLQKKSRVVMLKSYGASQICRLDPINTFS